METITTAQLQTRLEEIRMKLIGGIYNEPDALRALARLVESHHEIATVRYSKLGNAHVLLIATKLDSLPDSFDYCVYGLTPGVLLRRTKAFFVHGRRLAAPGDSLDMPVLRALSKLAADIEADRINRLAFTEIGRAIVEMLELAPGIDTKNMSPHWDRINGGHVVMFNVIGEPVAENENYRHGVYAADTYDLTVRLRDYLTRLYGPGGSSSARKAAGEIPERQPEPETDAQAQDDREAASTDDRPARDEPGDPLAIIVRTPHAGTYVFEPETLNGERVGPHHVFEDDGAMTVFPPEWNFENPGQDEITLRAKHAPRVHFPPNVIVERLSVQNGRPRQFFEKR